MCDIIQIRRELHQIPEVGMDLPKTLKYIINHLEGLKNIDYKVIEGKAVVAKTKHHKNNRFLAFRSDMDALPVEELNDISYKSIHPGIMHACGHDAHMAILLCFAEYINSLEDPEIGVMFIFQPGEEGNAGAKWLIDHGIFKEYVPERIFALHMFPSLRTGVVASRPGPLFIGTEEFHLKLHGTGGHAGFPENSIDLIEIFVNIFSDSRREAIKIANGDKYIFFFGKTITNGRNNVFPSILNTEGTIRAYDNTLMKALENNLLKYCKLYANNNFELSFSTPYLPVVNDSDSFSIIKKASADNKILLKEIEPLRIGEDFSYYLSKTRGAMFLLGCAGNGIFNRKLHSQNFEIDESSLKIGLNLFITIYDLCI